MIYHGQKSGNWQALCGVARGLDYLFLELLGLAKFRRPSAQSSMVAPEVMPTQSYSYRDSGVLNARRRHVLLNRKSGCL